MPRKKRLTPTVKPPTNPWLLLGIGLVFLVLMGLSLGTAIRENRLIVHIAPTADELQKRTPSSIEPVDIPEPTSNPSDLEQLASASSTVSATPTSTYTPMPMSPTITPTPSARTDSGISIYSPLPSPVVKETDSNRCTLYIGQIFGATSEVCSIWQQNDSQVQEILTERQNQGLSLEQLKEGCKTWLQNWISLYQPTANSTPTLNGVTTYLLQEQTLDVTIMDEMGCTYPLLYVAVSP